jgi:integral membrane protein
MTFAGYLLRVTDFADDMITEAERMAKALKVVALVETVSYLLLAYFWLVAQSDTGTKVVGSVHGMIWLAFVAMVVIIKPKIGWSWGYVALVVLTGPIGGLLVFARLQMEGVPDQYPSTHH